MGTGGGRDVSDYRARVARLEGFVFPPAPVVLIAKGDPNCDHDVEMTDYPAHVGYLGVEVSGYRQWRCRTCLRIVRQSFEPEPKPKLRMPEPT
jgi:hypothetical protein